MEVGLGVSRGDKGAVMASFRHMKAYLCFSITKVYQLCFHIWQGLAISYNKNLSYTLHHNREKLLSGNFNQVLPLIA